MHFEWTTAIIQLVILVLFWGIPLFLAIWLIRKGMKYLQAKAQREKELIQSIQRIIALMEEKNNSIR